MRARILFTFALGLVVTPIPASAQEAETLRREIEQLRQQLEATQQHYQQAIEALTPGDSSAWRGIPIKAVTPAASQSGGFITLPSFYDLRPAAGTLLPLRADDARPVGHGRRRRAGDSSSTWASPGTFVVNLTSSRVERDQVGTFAGRENRVIPREIELALFGQVDPYARATVILEAAEEFEDGERALEFGLAEAYLELTSLPFGVGAKGGRERLRFGSSTSCISTTGPSRTPRRCSHGSSARRG